MRSRQPISQNSPTILQSQARALPASSSSKTTNVTYCPSPTPVALKTRFRTSQLPPAVSPQRRQPPTPPPLSPYNPPTSVSGAVPRRSKRHRFTPYTVTSHSQTSSQATQSTSAPKPLPPPVLFKSKSKKFKISSVPYAKPRDRSNDKYCNS